MVSFKELEIYKLAHENAKEIHQVTFKLPKFEFYEQGSQIRRSSKRIKDTIADGYGRNRYKDEFIRFLTFAHASCNETISQLETLNELYFNNDGLNDYIVQYNVLGAKINKFIDYVEKSWISAK